MKTIALVYPLANRATHKVLHAAQETAALAYAIGMREQGVTVLVPLASHEETMLAMEHLSAVHVLCLPGWITDADVARVIRTARHHRVRIHTFHPQNLCDTCGPLLTGAFADQLPCTWGACPSLRQQPLEKEAHRAE